MGQTLGRLEWETVEEDRRLADTEDNDRILADLVQNAQDLGADPQFKDVREKKQGRIHGQQLRTGGQGRICAFSHFSTRVHGPTNQPTNQWTDKTSYRVACPQLKSKTG